MPKISNPKVIIAATILFGLLVLGIVVRFLIPIQVNITPLPNTTLSVKPTFTVSFPSPLSPNQHLSFQLQPSVELDVTQDNQKYYITPKTLLSTNTTYAFIVLLNNKAIRTVVYQTSTYAQATELEQQLLQQSADEEYANRLNKVFEQNPWIKKLPLVTKDYTVVYDSTTVGINIYPKRPLSESEKQTILTQIKSQGIPTDNVIWFFPTPTPTPAP
jgi:hypothetical protein